MKPLDPFAAPHDAGAHPTQPCGCGGQPPLPVDDLRLDDMRPDAPQLDACTTDAACDDVCCPPPVLTLVPKAADDAPC